MSTTHLSDVENQINETWAPIFAKELREATLLAGLVNKDYQGVISSAGGDTVRVSQINAPTGENRTVGVDADQFTSQKMTTSQVAVTADRRAVASFTVADLVYLQSQIGQKDSEVREALMSSLREVINDYLYSLVSPSTSAPDHTTTGVTDFQSSHLAAVRVLASQAKWDKLKPWYGLLDPQYYGDALDDSVLAHGDYNGGEPTIIQGQIALPRYGFNLLEDNSRSADQGLFFHPDFMYLVMQTQPTFKISDLHVVNQFGFKISVDCVYGAKLGIDGNKKHITVTA
jgi:hypothetical protein